MNTQIMINAMSGDVASIDKFYEEFEPLARICVRQYLSEIKDNLLDYSIFDYEDIVQDVMINSFSKILKNFNIEKIGCSGVLGFVRRVIFNCVKRWVYTNFKDGHYLNKVSDEFSCEAIVGSANMTGIADPKWTPEDIVIYKSLKSDILSKVEKFKLTDWNTYRAFPSRHVDILDYLKISELFLDGCNPSEITWYFTQDVKNQFWRKLSSSFLKDVLSPIVLMEIDNPIYYRKYESKLSKKAKKFIKGEGFYLNHSLLL